MTWLDELDDGLGLAGVRGGIRRRILAELADHIASDPESEARLGSAHEVAQRFAVELGAVRTRHAAYATPSAPSR